MNIVFGVLVGLFVLMFLVVAHEFGHFILARRNGVEVEEFGIGFPPRAIAWRRADGKWRRIPKSEWKKMPGKGLIVSVNWLPIGGFCQMKGESDADTKRGTFGRASYWGKTKILFGGVAMNWLVAVLILTVLAWVGMPHFLENQFIVAGDTHVKPLKPVQVEGVKEESPAVAAGLQTGDIIKRVQTEDLQERVTVLVAEDLLNFNEAHAGENIYLSYERDGQTTVISVTLNDKDAEYRLGAEISSSAVYRSTWSAPIVGVGTTLQLTGETFKGLGQMVINLFDGALKGLNFDETVREEGAKKLEAAGDSVSGPVGIIGVLFPAFTESGARNVLFLAALISVSLACMNVLPIPALDGGRWTMITIARLRKKRLSKEAEEKIVGRALIALLILAAIVTVLDVIRLFR